MKNTFLIIVLLFTTLATVNAQEVSDHAIGLRFNTDISTSRVISYQHKIKDHNRLEFNLGITYSDLQSVSLTTTYQWVFDIKDQFNWYVGGGAGFSNFSSTLFAAGIVGIEYNFEIPLLISLDYNPTVTINTPSGIYGSDLSLSLKYQF